MNGISIVVCCYNSSLRLQLTLSHLANQKTNLPFEIIVIDNASTDDTFLEAQKIWNLFDTAITFRIIKESKAGLCNARSRGVKEAVYEFIVFCDDDNWLDENYIDLAYNFLKENRMYAAIGGACEAVFENGTLVPEWFEDFKNDYAIGTQGIKGNITNRGYLWGAGITFRKSIYEKCINNSLPSLLADRNGKELSSGGDSEICFRFIILGYQLYYTNELKLKHFITPDKLTINYRNKLLVGFEDSKEIINKYKFYLAYVSKTICYNKIKMTFKIVCSFLKIRKMTKIDENLVLELQNYYFNKNDKCYQLIKNLVK